METQQQNATGLETLGGRIRAARMAKKLTVVAVARSVGVSRVCVSQWESGTIEEPKLNNLLAFTQLVDVRLDWLLTRKGMDPKKLVRPKVER
jgi:transcriptional regulator with XRE-family HTH domain